MSELLNFDEVSSDDSHKLNNLNDQDDKDGLSTSDDERKYEAVSNSDSQKDLSLLPSSVPHLFRRHSLGEMMQDWNREGNEKKKLETLSLKLEEVQHIRSVLSKAKIEVENSFGRLTLFICFPGATPR